MSGKGHPAQMTREQTRELLDEVRRRYTYCPETGVFKFKRNASWRKSGEVAGAKNQSGYLVIKVRGAGHLAHRLAWGLVYGEMPAGILDHVNRVKTDNRIANLRIATRELNALNSARSDNAKHVRSYRTGHFARIVVNRKFHYGPIRRTYEEAADDVPHMIQKLRGERLGAE